MAGCVWWAVESVEEGELLMALIHEMMENCCYVNRAIVDDAYGSTTETFTDGAQFKASIIKNTTTEAQIAAQQGINELYTIVVLKGTVLQLNDIVKRISDGIKFRVTSNTLDSEAPNRSSVKIAKVTAERWMPNA